MRARIPIVVGWLAIAAALVLLLPTVEQAKTGALGDLVATEGEAADAERRAVELFRLPALSRTIVVETARDGFEPEEVVALEQRARDLRFGALPGLEAIVLGVTVTDAMLADGPGGRATAALTYLFYPPDIGPVGRTGLGERLIDRHGISGVGRTSGLTGGVPARAEQIEGIADSLPIVELVTLLAVTLLMGLYFRSLGAPLANVVTVAIAYVISVRTLGGIGQELGIAVPEEIEPVMVALLFGIVTDYSIFFVSRFRTRLREGEDPRAAAARTSADLTPIVLTAGLSVAAACAVLVVARLGFFQAFGPGLAVAVLIAVAVVLTFVPATLALLGQLTFWPQRNAVEHHRERRSRLDALREAALTLPTRRPLLVAVGSSIPLVLLSVGLLRLEAANTQITGLPEDSSARQAAAIAARHFPAGAVAPLMVLVEQEGIGERGDEIGELERRLSARRNFAEVVGPATTDPELDLGAVTAPEGDAIRILAVLDVNPLGSRGIRTAARLREDLDAMLAQSGLPDAVASIGGDTAIAEETVRRTRQDLVRVVPAATLVVVLILAAFLRALVAPLYLVAASLLSLAASLGLTVLVFQGLLDYGELTFYVPFAGIVLLVALGSDYNVYLVGRVWAEARRRPLPRAIAVASARASSTISVAGVVLAFSFALLAIVPLRPFRELAFLLCSGLLIDAFLVRSMLAPALISLFGESGGWPGKGLRRLSRRGGRAARG